MSPVAMRRVLRPVPVLLLLAGAVVHVLALLGFKLDDEPLWTDVLFLVLGASLAILLAARIRWACWIAVLLFVQQVAAQGYWAVRQTMWNGSVLGVQQLAAALSVVGLVALVLNRSYYTRRDGATRVL